jgi:carboxylate-amine ligase
MTRFAAGRDRSVGAGYPGGGEWNVPGVDLAEGVHGRWAILPRDEAPPDLEVGDRLQPVFRVELGAVSKQLIPPDITGKGSRESGSSASVLDHRFGQSDAYTLGVEEEYQLLDGTSFDLVQHIDTVLAAIEGHELEPQINPELMQSVIEIATPVCHTPADVMRELTKLRGYVCGVAREKGMRVGSAGTHPFSLFERQRITAKDRYRQLVDQLQYIARRELIFGMHVHVAVDDPDKAIKVVNGLLPQLGPLLALSASSPFWRGEPTGLMSSRQMVFASFPRSGPPPRFRDYADYAEVVGQLERTGCIADYTHIWWDIRLHPRLGTIEIRICDAVTRVEDAVAITAYCQALVKLLSERHDAGEEIPSYHRILTTENKWLAARYGLEAPVMDLATGRRNRIPVAQLVRRTVREIEPHARELGSERELEGIAALLGRGNSADRQLRIFNANRDIREVVEEIAIATETLPAQAG